MRRSFLARASAVLVIAFAASTPMVAVANAAVGGVATTATAGCDTHKCYY